MLERVVCLLEEQSLRLARIEARLSGSGAPSNAAEDADDLDAALEAVLNQIGELKEALESAADPSERDERRRALGALRREQAVILFRMGSEAPGGEFGSGDTPLDFD